MGLTQLVTATSAWVSAAQGWHKPTSLPSNSALACLGAVQLGRGAPGAGLDADTAQVEGASY